MAAPTPAAPARPARIPKVIRLLDYCETMSGGDILTGIELRFFPPVPPGVDRAGSPGDHSAGFRGAARGRRNGTARQNRLWPTHSADFVERLFSLSRARRRIAAGGPAVRRARGGARDARVGQRRDRARPERRERTGAAHLVDRCRHGHATAEQQQNARPSATSSFCGDGSTKGPSIIRTGRSCRQGLSRCRRSSRPTGRATASTTLCWPGWRPRDLPPRPRPTATCCCGGSRSI